MAAASERVALRQASVPPRQARLREPQGHDEIAVNGVDTRAAVQLLDRLLEAPAAGAEPPGPASSAHLAANLAASDRDALLAALHRTLWGDRIVASVDCAACGAPYDLSFELSALQRRLLAQCEPAQVVAPRRIVDGHGQAYALPDADTEEAAAQLGMAAGRAHLAASIAGDAAALHATLGDRLEALAPLIDVDLASACAECGQAALLRFDLQSFVLQRLLDEREGVLGEVHALAAGYGWSLNEILSLPRSLRRALVQRVTAAPAAFG